MKLFILIIVLFLSILPLNAQRILQDYYYGDYGDINRVVIVLNSKTPFRIIQDKNTGEIVVRLTNTQIAPNLELRRTYQYKVLKSIEVSARADDLEVKIQSFPQFYLEFFELSGSDYKVVLDIFARERPVTLEERLNFAHFYYVVGYHNKALEQIRAIERITTERTEIYFYLGKIHLNRNNIDQAYEALLKVRDDNEFYELARLDIRQLERRFSHLRREKEAEPEPPRTEQTSVIEPDTEVPEPETPDDLSLPPSIDLDISNAELYESYRNYFMSSDDINQRLILTAIVTANNQEYDEALKLLQMVDKTSEFYQDALKHMYYIYLERGDEQNARVLHTLVGDMLISSFLEESGFFSLPLDTGVEFFDMEIKMWLALIIALLFAIGIAFLSIIFAKAKINKIKSAYSQEDISYHENKIKEAYEKKDDTEKKQEQSSEEKSQDLTSKSKEDDDIPVIEEETIDYDDIPVISEELTEEEKKELEEDSEEEKKVKTPIPNEHRKKMVTKLYKDGWDSEAIAKELQISQNEVELILKMDS